MKLLCILFALVLLPLAATAGRCTGKASCKECVNCNACVWCKPVHQGKGLPPVRVKHCGVCAPKLS